MKARHSGSFTMEQQGMNETTWQCPLPLADYPTVTMAHGGGGRLMHELIARMFRRAFNNDILEQAHDASVCPPVSGPLAVTTDASVVSPLFFPGGDIGRLAVFGAVNDLAVSGARPLYLSVSFILEEGLSMETLWSVVRSMSVAAREVGVAIVAGDTKVVDRGRADQVYLSTCGVGSVVRSGIGPNAVQPGDVVIVSGDVGRHGMAVMAQREGLTFESPIESDCAPLHHDILALLEDGVEVHAMRDLTRGGLIGALNEIAHASGRRVHIRERDIPVTEPVRAACEILGLDPLAVACEGRFVLFVPPDHVEGALAVLRRGRRTKDAVVVGEVTDEPGGEVTMTSFIGVDRLVEWLNGEQLPRIC